jgi:hypothetical protein
LGSAVWLFLPLVLKGCRVRGRFELSSTISSQRIFLSKDIQGHYKRKDLEKLESQGVKIIVTTKEAVSVKQNETQTDTESGSETSSSARAQTSAGCN